MVRSDNFPACLRLRRRGGRGGRGGGAAPARTPLPAARVQSNAPPDTVPATVATDPDTNTPPCAGTVPATDTTDPETAEELRYMIRVLRARLATVRQKNAAEAAAEEEATLRFWGLENVPGTVSVATVRAALGPGWRVVDRMLGLERVVVATATTDEPSEARLAEATGTHVFGFPYTQRTQAAPRSASDVVMVHCVAETAPTMDSALLTLVGVGFPLHTARRVFLPRAKGGKKKGRKQEEPWPAVYLVYVQMASPKAAQAVCPPRLEEDDLMPMWDAAFDGATQTCVHVLQVAKETFNPMRSGAVALRGSDGFWWGRNPNQVYGYFDTVACPAALCAPASVPVVVEGRVDPLSGDDSGSSGEGASRASADDRLRRLVAERIAASAAAGVAAGVADAAACAAARGAGAGAPPATAGAGAATRAGGGGGEVVAQAHPAWGNCALTTFKDGVSPIDAAATLRDATVESSVDAGDSGGELQRLKSWAELQVASDAAKDAAAAAVAAAEVAAAAAAAAAAVVEAAS
eukprot:Rhum_TRINITY_DN14669_c1_g1::Rhum_TRINITY_DN14669_c1_g1_i1::g.107149::m.107149